MLKQLIDRMAAVPLVGVDLGSAAVKLVELNRLNGQLVLERCAIVPVDGQEPAETLARCVTKAGVTASRVALGVAAPEVVVRPFQFPLMPKKELRSAIQLEAEQAILNGHSLKEVAADWQVFPAATHPDAVRGLIAVVPKEALADRLKVARAAGLEPTVVDVEGLALWNAYWALSGSSLPQPAMAMLVNIGARTTNLVIAKGPDELILVRDLRLGGQALKEGQGKEWTTEVADSLGYARSHGGLRTLECVCLTGGGATAQAQELLRGVVSAPIELWNPLHHVGSPSTNGHGLDESSGPLLAVAFGLALRQPI